ncbi:AzlC family ABC transporter permease [Psychrobium sp. 1_MG-2023]|uniref:AzlC family ABC transporter permease n=1 Tax=Psychrobium sp. 1_MG-2023 TaxID=3062624 RepID=UPI000C342796|nr:AzlC family ABC transporter permease [Psychrobium sp. 1_MG-2023]MDP2560796.1 AzlC family ABC transporter permease [Psychrobium sp. 1_MG-2023]PKF56673.1 branched-chain amino acid ABC transporter permease [Alteromonadales bacterium alter-6D02]
MKDSPKQLFFKGVFDALPLIVGGVPFGIIFGTLALNAGLDGWQTMGLSSIVFAGSAQFVAVGMLAAGTSIGFIVGATLIVNLRHLIYAASMLPYVKHLPQRWRIPLGFLLIDEVFAATYPRHLDNPDSANNHWHYLGVGVAFYVSWNLATLVGLFFGSNIEGIGEWGLDFAMSATFIGMVMPHLINRPMIIAVLVSGALAVVCYDLPHKLGLVIASVVGMATGYILEQQMKEQ